MTKYQTNNLRKASRENIIARHEAAGRAASTIRKQRPTDVAFLPQAGYRDWWIYGCCCTVHFLLLIQPGSQPVEWVHHPHFRCILLPLQLTVSKLPHRCAQSYVSYLISDHDKLTLNSNNKTLTHTLSLTHTYTHTQTHTHVCVIYIYIYIHNTQKYFRTKEVWVEKVEVVFA